MRRTLLPLLLAAAAYGAVDGTVINRTTNQPKPGAVVTLYKLGESGMAPVAAEKSGAGGVFRFDQAVQGPHLLQTIHSGVIYSRMLSPDTPSTGITVEVYDTTAKPGEAKVAQNAVLLEPADNQLFVTEHIIIRNDGNRTYNDPANGTVRVFVPKAGRDSIRVTATAPGGLPVERPAGKTAEANVFKVDFPVKPGETRIDVSYSIPFTTPGVFSGKVLQTDGPLRLAVPAGVTLKGEGLEPVGQEPQSQASIYGVKGRTYKVEVSGSGRFRPAQEAVEEDAGPSIDQVLPKIYDRVYWIIGLGLAILTLGFILLYRARSAEPVPDTPASGSKGKRRK